MKLRFDGSLLAYPHDTKLRRFVEHLFQRGLDVCVDALGVPVVYLKENDAVRAWPLASARVQGWISKEAFAIGEVLRRAEVDAVIGVLHGFAFEKNKSTDADESSLWQIFEETPILRAISLLMQGRKEWTGLMSSLLKSCEPPTQKQKLSTAANSKLPAQPNSLSAKLRELTPFLEQAGFTYSRERVFNGAMVRLHRVPCLDGDDAHATSSSDRSSTDVGLTTKSTTALPDDDDQRIRDLLKHRQQKRS